MRLLALKWQEVVELSLNTPLVLYPLPNYTHMYTPQTQKMQVRLKRKQGWRRTQEEGEQSESLALVSSSSPPVLWAPPPGPVSRQGLENGGMAVQDGTAGS